VLSLVTSSRLQIETPAAVEELNWHIAEPSSSFTTGAGTGSAWGLPEARNREVVADHQGSQYQGRMYLSLAVD
jgi:hypothetical protein